MKELVLALMLWINQNTGLVYHVEKGLPTIRQVAQDELIGNLLEASRLTQAAPQQRHAMSETVAAVYLHRQRAVLLVDVIDVTTVQGRAALLHELIHFVQFETGVRQQVSCVSELEADAYHAQAAYLRAHGAEPEFDEFTIKVRSTCWR